MNWWRSCYDPTGSTTYNFFQPNLGPDRGGPYQLLLRDVGTLFLKIPLFFIILCPFFTTRQVDELYLFNWTVFALIWFSLWSLIQAPFILILLAALVIVVIVVGFLTWIHSFLFWWILHGPPLQVYPRDLPANVTGQPIGKERWIYINGIATNKNILHQNLKLLSTTFGRPILGINNRTYGFLGDIIECILQRSFSFRTSETRQAYTILKDYLQDGNVNRIVLIAHSQGGILASHILDNLYTDLSSLQLQKLEVYTFGNAALHFNNPLSGAAPNAHVISHIEHYCNEYDLVCSWGALSSAGQTDTRFYGKVFVSRGATGHLLNQHYLSKMFPVPPAVAGPNDFLNQTAMLDPNISDKYWVGGTAQPPIVGSINISRLYRYLNGETP
ncbi:hypothetical protein F5884DRAFT_796150 [Xylogone sp. PMI_703]|nr:hypothetical protein F5884DRAFT_796150 [Xylogone sp. PMI_703]